MSKYMYLKSISLTCEEIRMHELYSYNCQFVPDKGQHTSSRHEEDIRLGSIL